MTNKLIGNLQVFEEDVEYVTFIQNATNINDIDDNKLIEITRRLITINEEFAKAVTSIIQLLDISVNYIVSVKKSLVSMIRRFIQVNESDAVRSAQNQMYSLIGRIVVANYVKQQDPDLVRAVTSLQLTILEHNIQVSKEAFDLLNELFIKYTNMFKKEA